jgi:hypothetical protein
MNFGFSVNLPTESKQEISYITKMSKKFNSIQIMFSKSNLNVSELQQIKLILANYKYIYVHANYQINIGSELIPTQTELFNIV